MAARRYFEPARTYTSVAVVLVLLVAGFLVDLFAFGAGAFHALAWAVAAVVLVGFDLLITHAVRGLRSITVTDDDLQVGETHLSRKEILGVRVGADAPRILGRRAGEGMPKGTSGITLQLIDGGSVVVASRHPERLAAALGADVGSGPTVRPADAADLVALPDIDRRAESLFHVAGMDLPELPFPVDALHEAKAVFVAGRPPVGFVQVDEVDGLAHVQELAVLPGYMRKGLGSALLDAACTWASEYGYPALTLTTYADVEWNGPFYAARGFVELTELTPELVEIRDWERDMGLDRVGRRIAMRRDLTPSERRD